MQKTAVGVTLAGFVLAFFSLYAFGLDLLIDAVGFLLVFNGARALAVWAAPFKPASAVALGLVAVAAAQLFFVAGVPALVLGALRGVGLAVLYLLFAGGFATLFEAGRQKRLAAFAKAVFWLAAAGSLLALVWPLGGVVLTVTQSFVLILLLFACILPDSLLY